jgi:hypothetical protein
MGYAIMKTNTRFLWGQFWLALASAFIVWSFIKVFKSPAVTSGGLLLSGLCAIAAHVVMSMFFEKVRS